MRYDQRLEWLSARTVTGLAMWYPVCNTNSVFRGSGVLARRYCRTYSRIVTTCNSRNLHTHDRGCVSPLIRQGTRGASTRAFHVLSASACDHLHLMHAEEKPYAFTEDKCHKSAVGQPWRDCQAFCPNNTLIFATIQKVHPPT
jgi:hypothetical protein